MDLVPPRYNWSNSQHLSVNYHMIFVFTDDLYISLRSVYRWYLLSGNYRDINIVSPFLSWRHWLHLTKSLINLLRLRCEIALRQQINDSIYIYIYSVCKSRYCIDFTLFFHIDIFDCFHWVKYWLFVHLKISIFHGHLCDNCFHT